MRKKNLEVVGEHGESKEAAMARTLLRPTVQAGISIDALSSDNLPEMELGGLIAELSNQVQAASEGQLGRGEGMLVAQAHTLDAIFHATLRRSVANMGQYPEQVERYMKLALKAQNQCRTTWEAVSSIKHPPTYVRQANIAHNQQVNNQPAKPENELLEHEHGERLDFGTTQAAVRDDPEMEAVGAVNRAEDAEGKSQGGQELG